MAHIVTGNFNASLSPDFIEAVSDARVRIYRIGNETLKNFIKGKNKREVQILTPKEISGKEGYLIGNGMTDSDGNYEIVLSDAYQDGPIAIDLKLIHLPSQKKAKSRPLQFTVRQLSPVWRSENDDLKYIWNYSFQFKFWSQIRTIFDVWTICGYVKSSENSQRPIAGAMVSAFDTDWIKDDVLGSGKTDDKGHFRIDFDSSDFKRTFLSPIVNVETPISSMPGPGVYFKVVGEDGSVVYKEDRAVGRTEERKHISRCHCFNLYLTDTKNKIVS